MSGIKRLDHVAMAVWDLEEQAGLFERVFGWKVVDRFENRAEGYRGMTLEIAPGQAQFELIAPIGDDNYVARFLRERGPGLHHVTFEVEDPQATAAAMRRNGIEPLHGVRVTDGWEETFMHPRDSNGVLFQFYRYVGRADTGTSAEEAGANA